MKRFLVYAILLCSLLGLHTSSFGQQPAKKLSWNDQFIQDRTGKPYPAQDSLLSLDGKMYRFGSASRPAFVYISSESCIPCKFELPLYIETCRQHPEFDFVYYDTDLEEVDTAVIRKKFGEAVGLPNLYVTYRPYAYFYERQLFLGFPTKYFVGSDHLVKAVQLGGWTVKEKVLAEWEPVLSQLN